MGLKWRPYSLLWLVVYQDLRLSGLAQRKKCFLGGIQGQLNVFRRMRAGHETRLICRRRQVYPLFQHGREEAPEGIAITGGGLGEVIHPALAGEEQAEHSTDTLGQHIHSRGFGALLQTMTQGVNTLGQGIVEARLTHLGQQGNAGGHGQRVARQGTRLIDRAQWRNLFHDLALATKGPHRHAPTDNLAQTSQIRLNAEVRLGASQGNPKTGHHLVKDQHTTVLAANPSQSFKEAGLRRNAVHVARYRLDDDAGNLAADLLEAAFDSLYIVIG